MKESILYAFIGMGVLSTAATIWIGTRPALLGLGEEVFAAVGILLWGAVALGATNVEEVTQCCRVVYAEPMLTYAGVVGVVLHVVLLLFGVVSLLDVRDAPAEAGRGR